MSCPPGLRCDGTQTVVPTVANSTWTLDGDMYVLQHCPRGHFVQNTNTQNRFDADIQRCVECSEGLECVENTCIECTECRPGTYKDVPGTFGCR
eukprot:3515615-Rhodomonas_salina.1